MGYAQALRDDILNWFRGTAFPSVPGTLYVALLETAPSDETGTGAVEVSTANWTNYARQSIASSTSGWNAPGGTVPRSITNKLLLDYGIATIVGGTRTIVAVAFYDAATAGTFWGWSALTANKVVNNGDDVEFPIGSVAFDQ